MDELQPLEQLILQAEQVLAELEAGAKLFQFEPAQPLMKTLSSWELPPPETLTGRWAKTRLDLLRVLCPGPWPRHGLRALPPGYLLEPRQVQRAELLLEELEDWFHQ
jgi:hypothetical protein